MTLEQRLQMLRRRRLDLADITLQTSLDDTLPMLEAFDRTLLGAHHAFAIALLECGIAVREALAATPIARLMRRINDRLTR